MILQTQQKFKSVKHNAFTEEIHKIALRSNDDKEMQLIHSVETYAYGINKDLVGEKVEIKSNNVMKRYKK